MVKEAIDLMDNGAITFNESDDEYDTMVSAMSKQLSVDTMIIHGMSFIYSIAFSCRLQPFHFVYNISEYHTTSFPLFIFKFRIHYIM